MSKKHSYQDIAENYELWAEYVDPGATMSKEDFERMSTKEKIETQIQMFNPDAFQYMESHMELWNFADFTQEEIYQALHIQFEDLYIS